MELLGKSKTFFLTVITILALSTMASGNTCTEAMFGVNSFVNQDKARIDSSYFNDNAQNEWTYKYIYNKNGQSKQARYDSKKESSNAEFFYFYYDTTETVLKNKGTEYIILNCNTQDTLCIRQKVYHDGTFQGEQISKRSTNYASSERIPSLRRHSFTDRVFTERILKNDTLFEIEHDDVITNSVQKNLIVADSTDDFKCLEYRGDDNTVNSITYKPNEKGYSISIDERNFHSEFFFVNTDKITFPHKTVKRPKNTPKISNYFLVDLY